MRLKIRLLSLFFIPVLVLSLLLSTLPASASFDPNDIMTDNIFNNYGSMSVSDINNFLNSFPNSCISPNKGFVAPDPTGYAPSHGFTYGANVTAGQVIYDAAQTYQVNPRVLLATMQKEQSLVTGSAGCYYNTPNPASSFSCDLYSTGKIINCTQACPYSGGCVNIAMGYNCPGNCAAKSEGFSQQVIASTWKLKFSQERSEGNLGWNVQYSNFPQPGDYWDNSDDQNTCYTNYMTTGNYKVCAGNSAVYWDGLYSISGQIVHMDNGATAALYNHTPFISGNQKFTNIYQQWFGATTQTTPLIYAPGAVSQGPGYINVFARGQDFREWQNWFSGSSWQINWNYIDNPSPNSSAPSAISWGSGHMDVFETRNGQLWHDYYLSSQGGWQGWSSIGAPSGVLLGGTPTVIAQGPGYINVFARGSDGRLWQVWYQNGVWYNNYWNYIEDPNKSTSQTSAVSWGVGHMDVFETRNGQLWHDYYLSSQGGWQGWQPLGSPGGTILNGQPGAVSQGPGYINVFARGSDGRLWQVWYQNGVWYNNYWNYIDNPSPNSSAPSAISYGSGHMDVFETRSGQLWHDYYLSSQGGWQGWQPLGSP